MCSICCVAPLMCGTSNASPILVLLFDSSYVGKVSVLTLKVKYYII